MKNRIENKHSRIWNDGTSPLVFHQIYSLPENQQDFHRVGLEYLDFADSMASKYGLLYIVSDFSHCYPVYAPVVNQYNNLLIKPEQKLPVAYKAIIIRKENLSEFLSGELEKQATVAIFRTFETALFAINAMLQAELILVNRGRWFSFFRSLFRKKIHP